MQTIIKTLKIIKRKIHIWKHHRRIEQLVRNGLKIGKNVWIMSTVQIDNIYPFLISIGNNCSLSTGVQIIAHDGTTIKFNGGYERIGRVDIKDNCHIGTNAIILPGVTIGPNVMVAAGSVVNKNIPPNSCVAGVPARFYGKFDDLIEDQKNIISKNQNHYDYSHFILNVNGKLDEKIEEELKNQNLFVFVGNRKSPNRFN